MSSPLKQEIAFFKANESDWVKLHPGKFVLVKGDKLYGVFDDPGGAINEGTRLFGTNPFLVRPVTQGEVSVPALTLGLLNVDLKYAA